MANNELAGETSQPLQQPSTTNNESPSSNLDNNIPSQSRNDSLLIVCRCFSLITAISAILCISVNVLAAVLSFKNHSDVYDGIFRFYAVGIAVFVVVAETEWGAFFEFFKVLEYWPGRGMLQIFVAVMTRAFPDYSGQRKDLALLQNIASYLLLSCGVVYLILGILCIGFLKRKLEQKKTTRDQVAKDLEEVERKKQELEALLIEKRV